MHHSPNALYHSCIPIPIDQCTRASPPHMAPRPVHTWCYSAACGTYAPMHVLYSAARGTYIPVGTRYSAACGDGTPRYTTLTPDLIAAHGPVTSALRAAMRRCITCCTMYRACCPHDQARHFLLRCGGN